MVLAILRGQKVDGYVLGTKSQPSELIETTTDSGKKLEPNPFYDEWVTVDQALYGWLFGSMSPAIAADVVNFKTSREVWKALEEVYGATSKARVNQLRGILQNTKKGSTKMIEYLAVMKQAAENLQLAGNPVSLGDQISYVLAGLDSEYVPIVCTIEDKDIKTWQELSSILVTFEGTLARYSTTANVSNELSDLAAHLALNRQGRFDNRQNNTGNRGNWNNSGYNQQQSFSRNNNSSNRGGRGRGRNNFQRNNSRPTCQLCGKYGHAAPACYLRFEESFNNPHAAATTNNNQGNNSGGSSAYIATPDILNDSKWLADSGATNHVTSDAGNLAVKVDYNGKESLIVGNGT
ncbi:MAG: hypothetical protein Q8847_02445 [Sweet potato little leaf phytoplasma]|nr:hypothetical protein [Sweet potato little leaf phytoplasma]